MTTPFQHPRAPGEPPWWLRPPDAASDAEAMRLTRWMETAKKEEAEACRMAKPGTGK